MSLFRSVRCGARVAGWWGRLASTTRPAALAAGGAVVLLLVPASVAQLEVPPDRQVLILTRALSYDSELKQRVGPTIVVAVLSRSGNPASEAMSSAILKAFRTIVHVKVQGLTLEVRPISYSNPAVLAAA